jgi:hypothetical protein
MRMMKMGDYFMSLLIDILNEKLEKSKVQQTERFSKKCFDESFARQNIPEEHLAKPQVRENINYLTSLQPPLHLRQVMKYIYNCYIKNQNSDMVRTLKPETIEKIKYWLSWTSDDDSGGAASAPPPPPPRLPPPPRVKTTQQLQQQRVNQENSKLRILLKDIITNLKRNISNFNKRSKSTYKIPTLQLQQQLKSITSIKQGEREKIYDLLYHLLLVKTKIEYMDIDRYIHTR